MRGLRMTTERKLGNQNGLYERTGLTESLVEVLSLNFASAEVSFYSSASSLYLHFVFNSNKTLMIGLEQVLHPHPQKNSLHSSLWCYFYRRKSKGVSIQSPL